MAQYSVYAFCDHCSDPHPMGINMTLDDGPAEKESIGNLYKGKEVPSKIAMFTRNYVRCPHTGRMFIQEDNNQIFLVALPD